MYGIKVSIKQSGNCLKNFAKTVGSELLIGILPDNTASTPPGEPSNAEKMYINSQGSPARNIPPRPVIEPVMDRMFLSFADELSKNIADALKSDNTSELIRFYRVIGSQCVKAIKSDFRSPVGGRTKNADETEEAKESSTPLIDTGSMIKSISYKIVNRLDLNAPVKED